MLLTAGYITDTGHSHLVEGSAWSRGMGEQRQVHPSQLTVALSQGASGQLKLFATLVDDLEQLSQSILSEGNQAFRVAPC